jgi:hypothetical protein
LLKNITTDKKILRLDDTDYQKIMAQFYFIFSRKNRLAILWKILQPMKSTKKIQRENVIHLCDTIIASVPFEYCLIIDDISSITPTTKKIDRLKDTLCRRRTNQSGEHLFYLELRETRSQNLPARSDAAH